MLAKRTNILFDQRVFDHLLFLAKKQKTSIGELVRKAVKKVYLDEGADEKKQAFENIIKIRKTINPIKLSEIKEFINYGRKY